MGEIFKTISEEEVIKWCQGTISDHSHHYLWEILTGEYPLKEAREDILSFRES